MIKEELEQGLEQNEQQNAQSSMPSEFAQSPDVEIAVTSGDSSVASQADKQLFEKLVQDIQEYEPQSEEEQTDKEQPDKEQPAVPSPKPELSVTIPNTSNITNIQPDPESDAEAEDFRQRDQAQTEVSGEIAVAMHALFIQAIQGGNLHKVKVYLDHKRIIRPDAIYPLYAQPALILAASKNNREVVALLLEHEADPNIHQLNNNETALVWAARHQNKDMMQLLVGHGAVVSHWPLWESQVSQGEKALTTEQSQATRKFIEGAIAVKEAKDAAELEARAKVSAAKNAEILQRLFGGLLFDELAPSLSIPVISLEGGDVNLLSALFGARRGSNGVLHAFGYHCEATERKMPPAQAPAPAQPQVEPSETMDFPPELPATMHLPPKPPVKRRDSLRH